MAIKGQFAQGEGGILVEETDLGGLGAEIPSDGELGGRGGGDVEGRKGRGGCPSGGKAGERDAAEGVAFADVEEGDL